MPKKTSEPVPEGVLGGATISTAALRRRLVVGARVRCVWRWYTGTIDQMMTVRRAQTRDVGFATEGSAHLSWMDLPTTKNGIVVTETLRGFVYQIDPEYVNVYEWVGEEDAA